MKVDRLKVMHWNGFVHWDIKPANILIGSNEFNSQMSKTIFLIDFGLTRLNKEELEAMNLIGTPAFASWNTHSAPKSKQTFLL